MRLPGFTYIAGDTAVHRCDARVKIAALLAFSVAVFALDSWWGLGALAVVVGACMAVARLSPAEMSRSLLPVYVLAAFSALFNVLAQPGAQGALTGAFFAVRMVVLVAGSFVVCLTTPATDLVDAFSWFIGPLRRLRVPVDDVAFTLALSLRFIPVIERELAAVRMAQRARGAAVTGSLRVRLRNWGAAFSAVFVGLFRHADKLAAAMDTRCYGFAERRTRLPRG